MPYDYQNYASGPKCQGMIYRSTNLTFTFDNSSIGMKFDAFLATVDDWGKFQKIKYSLICLTYTLPAIMVYTYTFSAATPNFRCRNPMIPFMDAYGKEENDLYKQYYQPTTDQCRSHQKTISVKECQRCFIRIHEFNRSDAANSTLKACNAYVYDHQYYHKSLVEEVITRECEIQAQCSLENSLIDVVEYGL